MDDIPYARNERQRLAALRQQEIEDAAADVVQAIHASVSNVPIEELLEIAEFVLGKDDPRTVRLAHLTE